MQPARAWIISSSLALFYPNIVRVAKTRCSSPLSDYPNGRVFVRLSVTGRDPFDEIARLIQEARKPFPVALAKRLVLRATSQGPVTPELADAIERLNRTIEALAKITDETSDGAYDHRRDALDAHASLRILCRRTVQ